MKERQLLGAILALVGGLTVATAGEGADPVVGTWHLDASQSTFASGPALKDQTRIYERSGSKISLEMKSMTVDGKATSMKTTYQLDGKDYPVTGAPNYDAISGKQLDSHTVDFVLSKNGKKMGTTTRTVSEDGKTLTVKTKVASASGEMMDQTLVFHKK